MTDAEERRIPWFISPFYALRRLLTLILNATVGRSLAAIRWAGEAAKREMHMRTVTLVTTLAIFVLGVTKAVAQPLVPGDIDLRKLMNPSEFSQAGLHKLDPEELSALNSWINQFFFDLLAAGDRPGQSAPHPAESRRTYVVEVSHDDGLFIINGAKYRAKTHCLNVHEGDRVIFTEGSAFGGCASAEFLNLRTNKKCSVWCE